MATMKDFLKKRKEAPQPPALTDAEKQSMPQTQEEKKAARKEKKAADKIAGTVITYHCGHKIGSRYLEGQNCPQCRNEKRREYNARRQLSAAKAEQRGRLPDKSHFEVQYDAEKVEWKGVLTIPGADKKVFAGTAPGVFKLLSELDDQYRRSLAAV